MRYAMLSLTLAEYRQSDKRDGIEEQHMNAYMDMMVINGPIKPAWLANVGLCVDNRACVCNTTE